jgi:cobyrinic acid a,c-diamide synthase
MTVIIAGDRSGSGKTTVTLALLAALKQCHAQVQSFKVGPDYIDPMFHSRITGRPCRNLDPILTSEVYVRQCFTRHSQHTDYGLIEGVMGLFDGASGHDDTASTAHIARLLDVPVILVLNCASISRSIAALVHGYRTFDSRIRLAGLVLNRIGSDRHLALLKSALEPLNLPILGILRRQDEITIPDRHLGLVPIAELSNFDPLLAHLAHLGSTCFDWQTLRPLLHSPTHPLSHSPTLPPPHSPIPPPRIAIAQDKAFNFHYVDNLEQLQQLGAELVPWSPIVNSALPADVDGLWFGGGFPEIFGAELAQNQPAQQSVRAAIQAGMPTYAECGGLMYLCQSVVDFAGQSHKMVGILPTSAVMGQRLTLGYRLATALQTSSVMQPGEYLWGHEFHRSTLTHPAASPLLKLQGYDADRVFPPDGWHPYQVHAAYTHFHFGANPHLLQRFLQRCAQFRQTIKR